MPAHPRAALAAVAGSSSASSSMAGLACSFGSLQLARGSRGFSSSSLSSSLSSTHTRSSSSRPSSSSSRQQPTPTTCCRRPVLSAPSSSLIPTTQSSNFSTSAPLANLRRIRMRQWYKMFGKEYKKFDPSQPLWSSGIVKFPNNPSYKVQPILSDETRLRIWERVVKHGEPVKAVAADFDIDMRRVAACVRLKELERSWILQGKPLAMPYANAIRQMIPTVSLQEHESGAVFEPTNEITVHPYTQQQLFLPVSESRHFTRADAAKAFHPTMLSADKRMPIPELVNTERNADVSGSRKNYDNAARIFREEVAQEQRKLAKRNKEAVDAEEARTVAFDTGRFEYRVKDYNSEQVGKTGRTGTVGWRYGAPHNDRKRGLRKIPSSIG